MQHCTLYALNISAQSILVSVVFVCKSDEVSGYYHLKENMQLQASRVNAARPPPFRVKTETCPYYS